uniref:Uncharacterized protein n=1 Tax=Alexandrium monilatum TaxID=311494 RepID=A0A7S4QAZ7_9DINO
MWQPTDHLQLLPTGKFGPVQNLSCGFAHTCAVSAWGLAKCWGFNAGGELGLGDVQSRGDSPDEMGDTLQVLDLGLGRRVRGLSCGRVHTCAALDDGTAKCWGLNYGAQLGLGLSISTHRGGALGEMGDRLPPVDLGRALEVRAVSCGGAHSCAIFSSGDSKCWGRNTHGQLGLGDTATRGDDASCLGALLPAAHLGADVAVGAAVVVPAHNFSTTRTSTLHTAAATSTSTATLTSTMPATSSTVTCTSTATTTPTTTRMSTASAAASITESTTTRTTVATTTTRTSWTSTISSAEASPTPAGSAIRNQSEVERAELPQPTVTTTTTGKRPTPTFHPSAHETTTSTRAAKGAALLRGGAREAGDGRRAPTSSPAASGRSQRSGSSTTTAAATTAASAARSSAAGNATGDAAANSTGNATGKASRARTSPSETSPLAGEMSGTAAFGEEVRDDRGGWPPNSKPTSVAFSDNSFVM